MGVTVFFIGVFVGFIAGGVVVRRLTVSPARENQTDLRASLRMISDQIIKLTEQQGAFSSSLGTLGNLSSIVTELKARYEEMKEAEKKLSTERDKRLEEFMESMKKAFEDVSSKTLKLDEQKEKRINELVERMKQFADEQRASTERFIQHQGQSREEIEKRRDAELKDMRKIMENFVRTVSGTKTRGMVGEMLLSEALSESIKVGTVVKNLSIGSMTVEFAWQLGAGKYIPIDSKLPDLSEFTTYYENAEDEKDREQKKRKLIQKVEREIDNVRKYANQHNTINSCILVVPSFVLEIAPELAASGKRKDVFLCTPKEVFAVAHYLEARYLLMNQDESGKYKHLIQVLLNILDQISQKSASLERALKTISNANNEIKTLITKARSSASLNSIQQEDTSESDEANEQLS